MWTVVFTKNAEKDKSKLKAAGLDCKTKALLMLLSENPFQTPPSYEKLIGDLRGYYSRRINIHHPQCGRTTKIKGIFLNKSSNSESTVHWLSSDSRFSFLGLSRHNVRKHFFYGKWAISI